MIKSFYSIKDELVGFNDPLLMQNDDVAIRTFSQSVNQIPEIKENAKDYSLYNCGQFDTETGVVTGFDIPVKVIDALPVLRKE